MDLSHHSKDAEYRDRFNFFFFKTQVYGAYNRLTSSLRTDIGSKWSDGKKGSIPEEQIHSICTQHLST